MDPRLEEANAKAEDLIQKMQGEKPPQSDPDPLPEGEVKTVEDLTAELTKLKHSYSVLQGKYNSEVKALGDDTGLLNRLKSENRTLRQQVTTLTNGQAETNALIKELREEKAKTATPAEPAPNLLSEEDKKHLESEDISQQTLDIILKLARSNQPAFNPADIENRVKAVADEVKAVKTEFETAAVKTWDKQLSDAIPDISNYIGETADPRFAQWLDEPVTPYSRRTRRMELQDAMSAQDLQAVTQGINQFKSDIGETKPPKTDSKKKPHIEPNESLSPGQKPINEGRKYTLAEVRQIYNDYTKGLYRGREKEYAALDKDITLAHIHGRII